MGRHYNIYACNDYCDKDEDKFEYRDKLWFGIVDTGVGGQFGSEPTDYYYISERDEYCSEYETSDLTDEEISNMGDIPSFCRTVYYVDRESLNKCDLEGDLTLYDTNFNFYCLFEAINNLKEYKVEVNVDLDDLREKLKSKTLTFEEAENIEMEMYDIASTYHKKSTSSNDVKDVHIEDSAVTLGYGLLFASLLFKYDHITIDEDYC